MKITPKVEGSALQASTKLMESPMEVTPIGIPRSVVTTMLIRIAPFTLQTKRMIARTRPIRNSQ